jgi:hypothetical protein
MGSVWSGKPVHNEKIWKSFDFIRSLTLWLSWLNVFIRGGAVFMLYKIVATSPRP